MGHGRSKLSQPPPHPQTKSRLCLLPVELLDQINDELPISSRASLALTSKLLACKQGILSWDTLKHQPADKQVFLGLLSKDHPRLLPCHTCLRLHDREEVKRLPNLHRETVDLRKYRSYLECRVSFAYVQLAMSSHRLSPGYDFLSHSKYSRELELHFTRRTPQIEVTTEFKIVKDRFLYKSGTHREIDIRKAIDNRGDSGSSEMYANFRQLIRKFRGLGCPAPYDDLELLCRGYEALSQGYWDQLNAQWRLLACGHFDVLIGFPILIWPLFKRAEVQINRGDITLTTIQSAIYRCRYCATEVQATIELSDATCWLNVTCWKDLGDGTAKGEEPWTTHTLYRPGKYCLERQNWYQPTHKHRGCISEAFECPDKADTTMHLSVPPFEMYDPSLNLERLYGEEGDHDGVMVLVRSGNTLCE